MFIKIVRGGHESLYPAELGTFDYGTRYLYHDPTLDGTTPDGDWLGQLREETGAQYIHFLIRNESSSPTGYREFADPENHPEDHGKPWWMVRWVAYDYSIPRGTDRETLRALIVTFGEVYIVGDNGKTIDRVRA